MLNISKKPIQFDFQARTDLATTANGTNINATIFSAFVAQDQTGSKMQIEMSRDKTSKTNNFVHYIKKKVNYFHLKNKFCSYNLQYNKFCVNLNASFFFYFYKRNAC